MKLRFALPALIHKLNKLSPDIVVSTMAGMNFVVLLAKPFLKKSTKVIIREAVTPSSIIDTQRFPGMVKAAYKNLYPNADLIIAPAQCVIDELSKNLKIDAPYALLHNPVDIAKLRASKPNLRDHSQTYFVAAGRLHKQKGFDRLIEALPQLPANLNWKLDILGAGPEKSALQTLITQNNLQSRVTLRGLEQNPWPYYGAADAFLLPSRWEGLPNVALESLAMGTPVISMKDAGGIDEIAALAQPGAITITPTIDEFIKAMERAKPNLTAAYRPSLLPDSFKLENIIKKFETML